jgi:hypothetical protein
MIFKEIIAKYMKMRFLILYLLFLLPQAVFATDKVEAQLSADREQVSVGESFNIVLSVKRLSTDTQFNFSDVPIVGLDNFNVLSTSQSTNISMVNGASAVVYSVSRNVEAKTAGEFTLGPISVRGNDGKGNTIDFVSNSLIIKVDNSVSENEEKDSSLGSGGLSPRRKDWLINSLVALIGIALICYLKVDKFRGFIVYKILRRKKDSASEIEKEVEVFDAGLTSTQDENFYEQTRAVLLKCLKKKVKGIEDVMTSSEIMKKIDEERYYRRDEVFELLQSYDAYRYAKVDGDREKVLLLLNKILKS